MQGRQSVSCSMRGGGQVTRCRAAACASACITTPPPPTAGIVFSHRKAGMGGPITRLMSCTPEDWEELGEADKRLADTLPIRTHTAPSFTVHPRTGDSEGALTEAPRACAKHALPPVNSSHAPPPPLQPPQLPVYPGINKPVAVADWLAATEVAEDFILVIDADMIMRRPLPPQVLGGHMPWPYCSVPCVFMHGHARHRCCCQTTQR